MFQKCTYKILKKKTLEILIFNEKLVVIFRQFMNFIIFIHFSYIFRYSIFRMNKFVNNFHISTWMWGFRYMYQYINNLFDFI